MNNNSRRSRYQNPRKFNHKMLYINILNTILAKTFNLQFSNPTPKHPQSPIYIFLIQKIDN